MSRADEETKEWWDEGKSMFFCTNSFFQSNMPRQEVTSRATKNLWPDSPTLPILIPKRNGSDWESSALGSGAKLPHPNKEHFTPELERGLLKIQFSHKTSSSLRRNIYAVDGLCNSRKKTSTFYHLTCFWNIVFAKRKDRGFCKKFIGVKRKFRSLRKEDMELSKHGCSSEIFDSSTYSDLLTWRHAP